MRGNHIFEQEQTVVMVRGTRSRAQVASGLITETVSIRSSGGAIWGGHDAGTGYTASRSDRGGRAYYRITAIVVPEVIYDRGERPKNIPLPPPYRRVGCAVYILANELPAWIEGLGKQDVLREKRRRGPPTVDERIKRRTRELD